MRWGRGGCAKAPLPLQQQEHCEGKPMSQRDMGTKGKGERRVFHREYAGAVLDPSGIITNFISLCIVYH